ncbi:ABC transporter, ATP-binding protein [Umbribacter vaginalis]|jgi:hypothetical protein|nr:ABC transporter, ATP-binding protein [Coriobacteriales bacterium DNF00809]
MDAIKVSNLVFGYNAMPVLKDLSFSIPEGDLCCITGENGSGKSTLMKLILGELKGYKGTISLFGKTMKEYNDLTWIGYVPQASVMNKVAFPTTCREIVVQGLYKQFGIVRIPRKKHYQVAEQALAKMDLERYARVPFNQLSGGLQQRVMICRALINDPKLLILDEPTAGVDKESKESFLGLLNKINQEQKITCLLVSHEYQLVSERLKLDSTYRIEDGRIANA